MCEMLNKEKIYTPKKAITQDNIYVVQQFVHVHRVVVNSLFAGKNPSCNSIVFLSQNNTSNPNLKQRFFYSTHRNHNGLKKGQKFRIPYEIPPCNNSMCMGRGDYTCSKE